MQKAKAKDSTVTGELQPLRLYLGGIPLQCTESDLRTHFEPFGEVLCSGINKNKEGHPRGCGYIVLNSRDCDADAARIMAADHSILDKKIEVKRYVECEKERQRILQEDNEKAVHVCGLPLEATESDVSDYFSKFGKIERAYIICKDGKSRGFGFIRFICPGSAEKVLSREHFILGKKIGVARKVTKNEKKKEGSQSGGTRSMTQTSSGAGSMEMSGNHFPQPPFGYLNPASGYMPPMNVSPQQCIVVNGVAYAPVGMNYAPPCASFGPYPPQFMPVPQHYGGYFQPQMGGYHMQAPMHPMGVNPQCHSQSLAPPTGDYSKHRSAGPFQGQPGHNTQHLGEAPNRWKANSTSQKKKPEGDTRLPASDAYSTLSMTPCYSAQEGQHGHESGKEARSKNSFFDKVKKQYCPFGKLGGFNPCEKVLATFACKKQDPSIKPRCKTNTQLPSNEGTKESAKVNTSDNPLPDHRELSD